MLLWIAGVPQKEVGLVMNLSSQHTKVIYFQLFRDVCSHHLLQTPGLFQFGGPGVIVQIDEIVMAKRKYNRGRVVPGRWVVGIYDTLLKRGIVLIVEMRNADTLEGLITQYVLPGTTIYTDG